MVTADKQMRSCSTLGGAVMLALTAAVLAACQSVDPSTRAPQWRIEPTQRVTNSVETASNYYALGRYYQGQNRIQLAIVAYRRAVALDPKYAEAHNALGTMSAMQGRLEEAIAEFRAAVELAPSAPHILSNLGYALTLQGRVSEAIPLLRRAASLEPGNPKISANLGLALSELEKMAVMPAEPAAKPSEVATLASAPRDVEEPAAEPAESKTPASAPREVEEPYASEQARAANGSSIALAPQRHSISYRLEIANGMGLDGAAAKVGEWLARDGAPTAQLRNQRPFSETTTAIYFSRGFEQEAQRLVASLMIPTVRVHEARLSSSDVRIVIGSDMRPLLIGDRSRAPVQQASVFTGS